MPAFSVDVIYPRQVDWLSGACLVMRRRPGIRSAPWTSGSSCSGRTPTGASGAGAPAGASTTSPPPAGHTRRRKPGRTSTGLHPGPPPERLPLLPEAPSASRLHPEAMLVAPDSWPAWRCGAPRRYGPAGRKPAPRRRPHKVDETNRGARRHRGDAPAHPRDGRALVAAGLLASSMHGVTPAGQRDPAGVESMRGLFRYRTLVRNLVAKDIPVKYRRSFLGLLWSLLNPALMLVVYIFAFKVVLRVRTENYAYFIMAGLLPWTFFAGALRESAHAIVGNAGLIREVYFPREILPIASVLFNFTQPLLGLAVFLPALMLVSDITPPGHATRAAGALVPPGLHSQIAFVLAAVTVHFRDVAHLTDVLLPLLFSATPIIYPSTWSPCAPGVDRAQPGRAFALVYQDVLITGPLAGLVPLAPMVAGVPPGRAGYFVFRRLSPYAWPRRSRRWTEPSSSSGVSKAFVRRRNPGRNIKVRTLGLYTPGSVNNASCSGRSGRPPRRSVLASVWD